jgi:hypothetical protein
MAAGLGYIEFATGDILTAAMANGYLNSQTVMVFASASARSTAITSPQQGMVTFLKDTNAIQYYNGSAWVAVGGATSPLTTKGDIYGFNTSNARIPVGTDGQVLTADSTASTGVAWSTVASGGMTLLSTTTLSGSATTLSSISQGYKELRVYIKDFSSATNNFTLYVELNSDTTASNYLQVVDRTGTSGSSANFGTNSFTGIFTNGFSSPSNAVDQFSVLSFPDYANSTTRKVATCQTVSTTGGEPIATTMTRLSWKGTAAISQLVLRLDTGTFSAGTVEIYGVK